LSPQKTASFYAGAEKNFFIAMSEIYNRRRSLLISPTNISTSQAALVERRKNPSLLSLQYKVICPVAIIVYIILQVVIGYNYIPTQNNFDTTLALKVRVFAFGSGMAFGVSGIQQIMNIISCRELGCTRDLQGIYYSILTVSSISGSASLLTFAINWGGIMTDVFGVSSIASQWAEWLVTVPMMVYIALAIEIKPALTKSDIIILSVFGIAIVFGFLLNIDDIPVELGYVFFIMGCCCLTVTLVTDSFNKVIPYTPSTYDQLLAGYFIVGLFC
jgi:hypothetical protein